METSAVTPGRILYSPTADGGLGGLARPAGPGASPSASEPTLLVRDLNASITRQQLDRLHQTPGDYDLRGHLLSREGGESDPQPLDTRFVVRPGYRVCMVALPPLPSSDDKDLRYALLIDPEFQPGQSNYSADLVIVAPATRDDMIAFFNLAVQGMESDGMAAALNAVKKAAIGSHAGAPVAPESR